VSAPAAATTVGAFRRGVDRVSATQPVGGNAVELLFDGPDTYGVMHEMIAGARHRIHLENYIIRDDSTGRGFADALIKRAQAGVKVRVLYDWIGSFGTPRRFWNRLREAGIEVTGFGPPAFADPLLIFARDHRKLLTVDGEAAVTGGLCIGDEWVGDPSCGRRPWRDTAASVRGPAARVFDAAFARAWHFAGGSTIVDEDEVPGEVAEAGDVTVRVVATEPGRERAWRTMELLMAVGAERIWITEAYMAAPQRLYQAFRDAARDGVDVRILLPGSSDIPLVRNLSRMAYRGLLASGVRIWEWGGPMLHAKTLSVDGRFVRVGSSNLNSSSLLANWELDLFIDDRALAARMDQRYVQDLRGSREMQLRQWQIPGWSGSEGRLAGAIPRRVIWERPDEVAVNHLRGGLERRRMALVNLQLLIRGARAAIFGPLALLLFVLAILAILFPTETARVGAVLAILAGAALAVRAAGHRARG
jgi:cardiolipin synthase